MVDATITKLAGLEETLLKEARMESWTVNIEPKIGIGIGSTTKIINTERNPMMGRVILMLIANGNIVTSNI